MAESVNVDLAGDMEAPKQSPTKGFSNFGIGSIGQFIKPSTVSSVIATQRQNLRPWMLFFQTSNFKVPTTLPRLSKRIVRNIEYFHSNYLFVFIILFAYCLVTSPILLLAICGCLFICYKFRTNPGKWKIGAYEITPSLQYGLVALCCLPVFLWAGAGSALFWVLGASVTVIGLHTAFYSIESIVTEESEDQFNLLEEV